MYLPGSTDVARGASGPALVLESNGITLHARQPQVIILQQRPAADYCYWACLRLRYRLCATHPAASTLFPFAIRPSLA